MNCRSISPAPAQSIVHGTITTIIASATTMLPTAGGNSVSRNVVTAPSVNTQAFGLSAWKPAAATIPSGLATTDRSGIPLCATW